MIEKLRRTNVFALPPALGKFAVGGILYIRIRADTWVCPYGGWVDDDNAVEMIWHHYGFIGLDTWELLDLLRN